jgi:hypothetical protein
MSGYEMYETSMSGRPTRYKLFPSVAHNFSHSFLSYMNYFDDGHVVDDLLMAARDLNGERLSVQWVPDSPPPAYLTARVLKSIAHYKSWLPLFTERSGADFAAIREFRTDIFLKPNKQVAAEAHLVDDRGRKYVRRVIF